MSSRPTVLFISNIPWDFVWQRHQTLASLFTRDYDVIFLEVPGIRRVGLRDVARIWARLRSLNRPMAGTAMLPENLRLVRPFVLPATNAFYHALNARLLRRSLRRESNLAAGVDVIFNYSASRSARWLVEHVPYRKLVYDCTDDWLAVRGIPGCLPGDERALLRRADLTLVPSRTLEERKRKDARRVVRVPHGALVERFRVPLRVRGTNEPITLLYYGHIHAQHLDCDAISSLAAARPHWRILLVGPVKTPRVFPGNVELHGQQPHEQLREFIVQTDVLLLPYALNEYTRAVLPAKIYECLATGRPTVAAPLPELVADFSAYLTFAEKPDDWPGATERSLASASTSDRKARIQLAESNTWENRYETIRRLLESLEHPG